MPRNSSNSHTTCGLCKQVRTLEFHHLIPRKVHRRNFYRKNFSNNEIDYCLKFNEPYQHFAGKFAIKEATKKALEIKLEMSQIRTEYQKSKPIISIPSKNYDFDVSVSHDGNYAVAIVIAKNKNL